MDLRRAQQTRARAAGGEARRFHVVALGGTSHEDPALEIKRSVRVRALLVVAAELLGFASPDSAFDLVDPDAVVVDTDGYPLNLPDLLEELLQNDPSLSKWYNGESRLSGG